MLPTIHTHLHTGSTGPLHFVPHRVRHSERSTHTYVIGITGKGKSKFLEHLLFQDIVAGRGCGVLDPHSDLIADLLRYLRSHPRQAAGHWQRMIYFDPTRRDYALPFNVLDSPYSPYATAQNIVEAFRRTWPQALAEAPRFTNIALASLLTLIANRLTLLEMPRLLTDAAFRSKLLEQLEDQELCSFWLDRYEQWGRETPLMIESVLNKVTAFTLNPHLRSILGAQNNALDFRRIMDEGKVLLVDLGHCDGETRRLVGSLVVTGMEQAALSRKESGAERTPFHFSIDEFQDFCANEGTDKTLAQILSECRKFGLHMTLAHQTLAQLSERMRGALGNIQLKVIFGVSREDAEILARQVFQVNGSNIKHQVPDTAQRDRSHPIFFSLMEEWERFVQKIQNLPSRHAYLKRPGKRGARRIRTATVRYVERTAEDSGRVKRWLARRTGRSHANIERQIRARLNRYERNIGTHKPKFKEAFTAATSA